MKCLLRLEIVQYLKFGMHNIPNFRWNYKRPRVSGAFCCRKVSFEKNVVGDNTNNGKEVTTVIIEVTTVAIEVITVSIEVTTVGTLKKGLWMT